MLTTDDRTFTITDAARELRVGRKTIYRMLRDGDLTSFTNPLYKRQSPGHRIPQAEIARFREALRAAEHVRQRSADARAPRPTD